MNVIWIVADTFRKDHLGAYGNSIIRTPSLDGLASKGVKFMRDTNLPSHLLDARLELKI